MDREVWCAAVYGVAKSWTRLSDWTTTGAMSTEQEESGENGAGETHPLTHFSVVTWEILPRVKTNCIKIREENKAQILSWQWITVHLFVKIFLFNISFKNIKHFKSTVIHMSVIGLLYFSPSSWHPWVTAGSWGADSEMRQSPVLLAPLRSSPLLGKGEEK